MLLRTLAEDVVFARAKDADARIGKLNRRRREQFRAISIVPVGGVDFAPFVRLLLNDQGALVDRLVVITDGDTNDAGTKRKQALEAEFSVFTENRCLVVAVGGTTLEAELFAAVENEELLREAFQGETPQSLEQVGTRSASTPRPPTNAPAGSVTHSKPGPWTSARGTSPTSSQN